MQTVAEFRIARAHDASLAVNAEDKAINLLPEEENGCNISDHPLALLFTPLQVRRFKLHEFGIAQTPFESTFDAIHNELKDCITRGKLDQALRVSLGFEERHQINRRADSPSWLERAYLFFTHRAANATPAEIQEFVEKLSSDNTHEYFAESKKRIDLLKAEILVKSVLGTLGTQQKTATARLRAEAGLVALLSAIDAIARSPKDNPNQHESFSQVGTDSDYAFVKFIASARIHVPSFAFDTKPKTPSVIEAAQSPLARRLKNHTEKIQFDPNGNPIKVEPTKHDGEGPEKSKCECDCDEVECLPVDTDCVDIKYYLTDLLELREETHCYKASDLAYIENIAPRELRLRKHKFVKSIEDFTEEESTETRTEERDHQVTERSNVQKEVEKQMSQSLDVQAKINGGKYSVDTNASLSRDVAQREAREKFREMVTKAVQKIQTETRQLRSRRVTTEATEENEHTFDNRESDDPKVAKYFYVSQEKRGQVFSHGLRLMLDVLVPSPAALYKELEARKIKEGSDLKEPKKPNLSPSDFDPKVFPDWNINSEGKNYQSLWEYLLKTYDISDLPVPPEQRPAIPPAVTDPYFKKTAPGTLTVPEGYRAIKLEFAGGHANRSNFSFGIGNATMELFVGSAMIWRKWINEETSAPANMNDQGTLNIRTNHTATENDAFIKGRVHFQALPVDYSEWQKEAHATIMAKYEEDLAEYKRLLEEQSLRKQEERDLMHPFTAEEHMRTQMKQAAIFMMCDDFRDEVMNMCTEPCGYPTFFREAAQEATSRWYFFDRAFDWRQAEFIFFDYFRNPICKWHETFDPDESNFLFKAFKRAGYARIQIPCAPGMEDYVLHYLQTQEVWNGDDFGTIGTGDVSYQSVVTELKHSYECNQTDRPGTVRVKKGSNEIEITCSDFYCEPGTSGADCMIDTTIVTLDRDREIFIDGVRYRIIDIEELSLSATDPDYDPDCANWKITLERPYEGDDNVNLKHAVGAKYVGDPFFFELPTEMVWLGDLKDKDGNPNNCLPCYPVECWEQV